VSCDTSNTATLANGSATCSISSALVFAASPYAVSATYSGDPNFVTSTSPSKLIKVPKA